MEQRIKVLGINDDRDSCQCCGKEGLKRVVWLSIDDGQPVHYGTTCAARAGGIRGRWTSDRAESLVQRLKDREARIAKSQRICDIAQAEANRTGKSMYVGYTDLYCKYLTWFDGATLERNKNALVRAEFQPMTA